MSTVAALVGGRVTADEENWRAGPELRKCWQLEDQIEIGLRLYRWISDADEAMSKAYEAGGVPFDAKLLNEIRAAYTWWLTPCEQVSREISALRRDFEDVAGSEDFYRAWKSVRALISVPVDVLASAAERRRTSVGLAIREH